MHNFATAVCFSIDELMEELSMVRRKDAKVAEQVREWRKAQWNADL